MEKAVHPKRENYTKPLHLFIMRVRSQGKYVSLFCLLLLNFQNQSYSSNLASGKEQGAIFDEFLS